MPKNHEIDINTTLTLKELSTIIHDTLDKERSNQNFFILQTYTYEILSNIKKYIEERG